MWADWLAFAGVMALGQFSPGPDMVLLTRTSLKEGRRAGWLMVAGIVTGLCFHSAVAIGGISVLMSHGGGWEKGLSLLAAAYLGWLGWQLVRLWFLASYGSVKVETVPEKAGGSWYLKGLLCNLLNPKVVIFFAGITTVFLKGDRPDWWPYLLWLTIVGEGLVLWGIWVCLLQNAPLRRRYEASGPLLDLLFGLGLWVLAGLMLWRVFG